MADEVRGYLEEFVSSPLFIELSVSLQVGLRLGLVQAALEAGKHPSFTTRIENASLYAS